MSSFLDKTGLEYFWGKIKSYVTGLGYEANQNAFSNVKVGSTTVVADTKTDTLELVAGSNVTLTPDATNDKVTITATNMRIVPSGSTASSSTNTAFVATVDGITALSDGVSLYLKNTIIDSAENCTLNINGLGAKPIYLYGATGTDKRVKNEFVLNSTMYFIYNATRVTGGCWEMFFFDGVGNFPIFETHYNSTTQESIVTCNKTYGECWDLCEVGSLIGIHDLYMDNEFSMRECVTARHTSRYELIYTPYGCPYDIKYNQNETIEFTIPSSDNITPALPVATKGSVNNNSIIVTPSVTYSKGWISLENEGTVSGDSVTVSASELVSGTLTINSSGTKDVTNYASVSVGAGTEGTPTAIKGTVSGHSITVTPSVTNTAGYISGGTKTGTGVSVSASELVSGTKSISTNGTDIDVTNYESVDVSVPTGTARTSSDITVSGATVTVPAGLYSSQATKSVASGTAGTPTATKGTVNNHSVSVTPSVTNTTGYITGGTKTGTAVTVSASELVSGTKTISENGTGIDVTNYATVDVDIPSNAEVITIIDTTDENGGTIREIIGVDISQDTVTAGRLQSGYTAHDKYGNPITGTLNPSGGDIGEMQAKTNITPTESSQTITADSGYDGLSSVQINGISSTYVGSGIDRRTSSDLTASGATVTAPAGYYSTSVSKSVVNGTAGTPSASKGTVSNHSITITPTVTNTTGYITGGTKTGTGVSVSASELVSGTLTIDSSGTKDVTNYASASVAAGSAGTPSASKGTVSNHSVAITPSVTNTTGFITGSTKTGTAVTVSASELVSGNLAITDNGTGIDVTNYATVSVDVESSGGSSGYTLTTVAAQQTVTPTSNGTYYNATLSMTTGLEAGSDYIITFNGTEYYFTCQLLWGTNYLIGDANYFYGNTGLPYPFGIIWMSGNTATMAVGSGSSVTVKIEKLELTGGSGGGDSNIFVIGLSYSNSQFTPDCTFAEYKAAYQAGKSIYIVSTDGIPVGNPNLQSDYVGCTIYLEDSDDTNYFVKTYGFDWNENLSPQTSSDQTYYNTGFATAVPADVTQGKIFFNGSGYQVGTASGGSTPSLQAKTNISPTTSSQTITPDSGYDGLSSVQINAMPSGTAGTPSATKGTVSNHSISVTPSVTNTTGYITGGTKTGTAVTVSASELVSGTKSITSSGTTDVTNYASASVASGTATAPSSISGSSATVSTGTNTLTLTKTVSVTPNVSTAGYISAGTAGNSSVSLTASVTTKAATTYHPSTSDQTIASGTYTTGTQTIKGVTVSGLSAQNIASGVTVKIGDSTDDDCVTSVTGTLSFATITISSSNPSGGSDGDIWIKTN